MNVNDIKEIIQAFDHAQLTDLELKCEAFQLNICKGGNRNSSSEERTLQDNKNSVSSISTMNEETNMQNEQKGSSNHEQKVITSPIVGTFYSAEQPGAKPLVEVGSYVHKGDVVCIIEAMKLMNEVTAAVDGVVKEILVADGDMVEYGQILITLD